MENGKDVKRNRKKGSKRKDLLKHAVEGTKSVESLCMVESIRAGTQPLLQFKFLRICLACSSCLLTLGKHVMQNSMNTMKSTVS